MLIIKPAAKKQLEEGLSLTKDWGKFPRLPSGSLISWKDTQTLKAVTLMVIVYNSKKKFRFSKGKGM